MAAINLLQRIARDGWSDSLAADFERCYGKDIRRLIVLHIWKAGLVSFRFDPRKAQALLSTCQLEVFENTLSDTWIALASGLVGRYVELTRGQSEGFPFLKYLGSTIRNLVIDNARSMGLLPRESIKAILRAMCQARKDATRRARMAQVKSRLLSRVEQEVLSCLPCDEFSDVYSAIHHVADYFFERYVPSQCQRIGRLPSRSIAEALVETFVESELSEALTYVGEVTPWDDTASIRVCRDPEFSHTEDEFLSLLSMRRGEGVC